MIVELLSSSAADLSLFWAYSLEYEIVIVSPEEELSARPSLCVRLLFY